ncbi:MAG: hypothetical protein ABIA78_00925 [archaeon]
MPRCYTVKEYGLKELQKALEEGYRIIVEAKGVIRYKKDFVDITNPKGEELEKLVILPETKGEILEVGEEGYGVHNDGSPLIVHPMITKMGWYKKNAESGNIITNLNFFGGGEKDYRLEDLMIVGFPMTTLPEDSRQLRFFRD